MKLDVLHEDNHLLAVNKPVGIATMGAAPGRETVLDDAKRYLRERYSKPGAVYLGVVSRLDAPVSGVLLFARTSKAAQRLTDSFRQRRVEKHYLAAVVGNPSPKQQTLKHHLRKDERQRKMHTTHAAADGATAAELSFAVLQQGDDHAIVRVDLATGRKHQIRVQMAKIGHPILGDQKYGSNKPFPAGIGLHAERLSFEHPVRREPVELIAPLPRSWRGFAGGRDRLA